MNGLEVLLVVLFPVLLASFALLMEHYQEWIGRPEVLAPSEEAAEKRRTATRRRLRRGPRDGAMKRSRNGSAAREANRTRGGTAGR